MEIENIMNKKVSLIVPVYNVEKYLQQCIESITSQTYENIEIIIVNDGSTDKSRTIIERFMEKEDRIIYIEQDNKGVSVARNKALKISTGDYILFIDSDDYLNDNSVEILVQSMIYSNADMVIAGFKRIFDDNIKGKDNIFQFNVDKEKEYSGIEVSEMMLKGIIDGFLWNKMFKRELLIKNGFEFEENRYFEDWYPVFNHISSIGKIKFLNQSVYNYRQRQGSTVNMINEKKLIDYEHAVCQIINKVNCEGKYSKDIMKAFQAIALNGIIRYYCELNIKKSINIYTEFKNSKYSKYELSLSEIIKMKNINKKIKINLILWNCKVYHIALKILR